MRAKYQNKSGSQTKRTERERERERERNPNKKKEECPSRIKSLEEAKSNFNSAKFLETIDYRSAKLKILEKRLLN